MTIAVGAPSGPKVAREGQQARHKRPGQRRRRLEQAFVAFVLFVAFAVTVVLLGLQWLGNQGTASSAAIQTGHSFTSEVQPS